MIKDVIISDMHELVHELNSLENSYIYRGHADASWELVSTLERISGSPIDESFLETCEKLTQSTFQSKFHIYDTQNETPKSKLGWLSLMQHYGVPTRLLDFTTSPYVALYFAVETYRPESGKDFAVYAIDYNAVMDASIAAIKAYNRNFKEDLTSFSLDGRQDHVFDEFIDQFSHQILWATEPSKLNVRIERQCGCFLFTGRRSLSVEAALALPAYEHVDARKLIIPGAMFQHVYALLRKVNISASTIYGDLQGLASSLRTYISVMAAVKQGSTAETPPPPPGQVIPQSKSLAQQGN